MKIENIRHRLLEHLERLPPGATLCPGKLARDCGTVLAAVREDILSLAAAGEIRLTQRGKTVDYRKIKGPFRVARVRPLRAL